MRRGAWFNLVDRVDPDLQTWLAAHPGRYILKLTLPNGLRDEDDPEGGALLGILHDRIRAMLASQRRADYDEAAVLRLDPLMLMCIRWLPSPTSPLSECRRSPLPITARRRSSRSRPPRGVFS